MKPNLFYLHALSALHCGTGQAAGVIDLPIARDRASNLPLVPGSSLRGVLRDNFAGKDDQLENALFGPRTIGGADEAHAGD
jgi:CRISPR-associated protein Cmr4